VTFRLLLLRHATAEDPALVSHDAVRALTGKGRRQVQTVARFCQHHALQPHRLLCSPLVRAVETATQLGQHLADCPLPQVVDWLALGTPTAVALAALQEQVEVAGETAAAGPLCLVGHEPDLSALVDCLLGTTGSVVAIRKASLTCLELPAGSAAGSARLLWSIPCALMR
jgi:phosphohistidine phosphatase